MEIEVAVERRAAQRLGSARTPGVGDFTKNRQSLSFELLQFWVFRNYALFLLDYDLICSIQYAAYLKYPPITINS